MRMRRASHNWAVSVALLLLPSLIVSLIAPKGGQQHGVQQQRQPRNKYRMSQTCLSMATDTATMDVPPRALIARGMQRFRQGDVKDSIELFDQAEAADSSLRPYLWQRGISYYYADRFQEGSDQFRFDVKVNPLDVEEIVWDIACLSRLDPNNLPPPSKMSLPKGKTDRRKIMSTVYDLFRGDATEHDLAQAGHSGNPGEEFYSLFYLGLFCESRGELTKAESYMKQATQTKYATSMGAQDYMTSVARVHCQLRGWA